MYNWNLKYCIYFELKEKVVIGIKIYKIKKFFEVINLRLLKRFRYLEYLGIF